MLKNYLTLSLRKFSRQKFYSLLNIFGLATGMATVILIMLYVTDELSYDRFHRHEKDLYRVVENQYYSGQPVFPVAVTPGPLAEALKSDFPEISRATRVHYAWDAFEHNESRFDTRGIYADKDFLSMFDFVVLQGDTATALDEINSILITERLAEKLFADTDPLGKTIRINHKREAMITGIMRNPPPNSHLQFDYVMPMSQRVIDVPRFKDDWGSNSLYTYVQLAPGTQPEQLDAKIKDYLKTKVEKSVTDIFLQPISDIHLSETSFVADSGRRGNRQYIRIFSIVAGFILIIACINFMNLATARAMKRAREVGLRKAIGAQRHQLVLQFLGESIMVALVALLIALLFVDVLLQPFNSLTQKSLTIGFLNPLDGILPACLAAALITGLLAGSYPAVFLSSFQPAHVLKGTLAGQAGGGTFRKLLVVVQFSISIVMISGTIVVYSQMNYIRGMNIGWDRENMLLVSNARNTNTITDRLLSYPQIEAVTASNQHPIYVMNSTSGLKWKGKIEDEVILFHTQGVDYNYIETMKIELLMGRSFSKTSPSDTLGVVINEEAMKALGFANPLGEYITNSTDERFEIIGVVKNFNFKSVHEQVEPLIMYIDLEDQSHMLVRIKGDNTEAIANIEKEWKTANPDLVFSYSFLNEDYDNLYKSERQTGTLFQYFSILAILISCLGLFGLAAFTSEQKSKEYGIRKVFGASVSRLFYMASAEFLILVVLSFVISVPIAWFWMQRWLDGFAYRIELSWVVFLGSGIIALTIALLTVSYQARKVGRVNPARILRAE